MLAIRSHPETWDVVELSLELNFDRTLGQLERAQRMPLGAQTRSALFGVQKNEGKGKRGRPG